MWVGGTAGCEGIESAGGKVKEKQRKKREQHGINMFKRIT